MRHVIVLLLATAATPIASPPSGEAPVVGAVASSISTVTLEDAFPHVTEGTHGVLFTRVDVTVEEPLQVCPGLPVSDDPSQGPVTPGELLYPCASGQPQPLDLLSITQGIDAVSQAVLFGNTFLRCSTSAATDDFLPFAIELCPPDVGSSGAADCLFREAQGDEAIGASQLLPVRDLLRRSGRVIAASTSGISGSGQSTFGIGGRRPDFSLLFAVVGDSTRSSPAGAQSWPAGCTLHIQDEDALADEHGEHRLASVATAAAGTAGRPVLWRYDADEPFRAVVELVPRSTGIDAAVPLPPRTSAAAAAAASGAVLQAALAAARGHSQPTQSRKQASEAADAFSASDSQIIVVPGLRQPLAPTFASRLQQTHLYPHLPPHSSVDELPMNTRSQKQADALPTAGRLMQSIDQADAVPGGGGSGDDSGGSITAFLEFDGSVALHPHAAAAAAAADRLRRRGSRTPGGGGGGGDAEGLAVLIEAHAAGGTGLRSDSGAGESAVGAGFAAATLSRRRIRRRNPTAVMSSADASVADFHPATTDASAAAAVSADAMLADAFLEAGLTSRSNSRRSRSSSATVPTVRSATATATAASSIAAEADDSHVPALIDAQLAALAVFRHQYGDDEPVHAAGPRAAAAAAAEGRTGRSQMITPRAQRSAAFLETASGQPQLHKQPQPFVDALQQLDQLSSSDFAADAIANMGLDGASSSGAPRLAIVSTSPFEHDHDEYHIDEDDGALQAAVPQRRGAAPAAIIPAASSESSSASSAAAESASAAADALTSHVFPTALQRHIARLQPALMHGFVGSFAPAAAAAAAAAESTTASSSSASSSPSQDGGAAAADLIALEVQGRAGASAGTSAEAQALARAAAQAAARASASMSAYLAARVTGLKSIMDPIVGSVMNPTSKQITSPIAGQMTDAVGNGAGQELKGEAVSDVAALLTRALTYNLTALLTDLVTTKTTAPLSTAMTNDIMPSVAHAAIEGSVARIHDALTAHGLSEEHRRDDGDAFASGRRTGRPGVPPAPGESKDDGDQSVEGSPIIGTRLGATKSGAQWVPADHDGRTAPMARDPKGKPLPRPDAAAGAPGAFDDGTGALLEPPREPVLVELISDTVRAMQCYDMRCPAMPCDVVQCAGASAFSCSTQLLICFMHSRLS